MAFDTGGKSISTWTSRSLIRPIGAQYTHRTAGKAGAMNESMDLP